MDKNVFLVNQSIVSFAKMAIDKSDGSIQKYRADNSVYRTVKVLLAVLKYECEHSCNMDNYVGFIRDLIGMMAKHADENEYTIELDRNIMADLPNMSVYGIQLTLMQISTNIALYEILHDEYMNYKYTNSTEKEDDEEFLLKKIDAE